LFVVEPRLDHDSNRDRLLGKSHHMAS